MKTNLLRQRVACLSLAFCALLTTVAPLSAQGIVVPAPDPVPEHRPGFFERLFGPKKSHHRVRVAPEVVVVDPNSTVIYADGRVDGTVVSVDGHTQAPPHRVARSEVITPDAPVVKPAPRITVQSDTPAPPKTKRIERPVAANKPSTQYLEDPAVPPAAVKPQAPETPVAADTATTKPAPLKKRSVTAPPAPQIVSTAPPAKTGPKAGDNNQDASPLKSSAPEPKDIASPPPGPAKNNALVDMPPAEKKDIRPEPKQEGKVYPVGSHSSKPGFVKSPFEPFNELDATGMITGSLARDPTTGKIFRMP